jgi:molybdopterin synthase sulfur carrier subunit
MIQVKLFGNLRQHAGQATVKASGATIHEVLLDLCAAFPALNSAIFDNGQLHSYVRVMINGRDIELAQGLDTLVDESDQVAIFPPIAGG